MEPLPRRPLSPELDTSHKTDTPAEESETVRYGNRGVSSFSPDSRISNDCYSSSAPVNTPILEHQVSHTSLGGLKTQWQQLKNEFQREYPKANNPDEALKKYIFRAENFSTSLWQFSVNKSQLSSAQLEEFNQLLMDVKSELTPAEPDSGKRLTVGGQGKAKHGDKLYECCDMLKARLTLNAMIAKPDGFAEELSKLSALEKRYNTQPDEFHYEPLKKYLAVARENVDKLSSMTEYPETADVAWLASKCSDAVRKLDDELKFYPEEVGAVGNSCSFCLRSLRGTEFYQNSEWLYEQTPTVKVPEDSSLTATLSEEDIPALGQTPSSSMPFDGSSKNTQASLIRSISRETTQVPHFEYKPLSVEGYEPRKASEDGKNHTESRKLELKPITPELEDQFQEIIQKDGYNYYSFKKNVRKIFSQIATKEDLPLLVASTYETDISRVYDTNIEDESTPYLHSQVKVTRPNGEHRLCANQISYEGKPAGIAMRGPVAEEMPDVMQMAWEKNARVFVNLMTNDDHISRRGTEFNRFDWASIAEEPGQQIGEYIVAKCSEDTHEFNTKVWDHGKERPAKALVRKFRITNEQGESREISQISFPDWLDGTSITKDLMLELQDLVAREEALYDDTSQLVVNCKAGVGRTGTFFATRHLRNKAAKNQLDPEHINAEVLQTVLEGKLYRNDLFVQYPSQARLVTEMANHYAQQQSFMATTSPEAQKQSKITQIGDYRLSEVTLEITQKFVGELNSTLKECDASKARYEKVQDNQNRYYSEEQKAARGYLAALDDSLSIYTGLLTETMVESGLSRDQALSVQHSLHIRENQPDMVLADRDNPFYYDDEQPYTRNETDHTSRYRDLMACPLTHTQLSVKSAQGQTVKLCANSIHIAGKDMGIAMQAPREEELDLVLKAAVDNNIQVQVDLASSNDRGKLERRNDPALDWRQLNYYETERYILDDKERKEEITSIHHEGIEYKLVHKTFDIQPKDGSPVRMLDQYTLVDWPDGQPLPHQVLKQVLKPLRNKKVMANCVSGVGRTGSLFAGKHIDEEISASTSGKGREGQLALEGIMHTRLSRSGSAITSPYQARELIRLEDSY